MYETKHLLQDVYKTAVLNDLVRFASVSLYAAAVQLCSCCDMERKEKKLNTSYTAIVFSFDSPTYDQ
jgi:hypothetical protein